MQNNKIFKIEQQVREEQPIASPEISSHQHNELMSAIGEIKDQLANTSAQPTNSDVSNELLENFRNDMAEAAKLKSELMQIQKAIDSTKFEIAALHLSGEDAPDINRMTNELGAIVDGTEHATETILTSAEHIDENAGDLMAALDGNQKDLAADIQEHVVKIFESCNFQDLTGQRIGKVVKAFGYIEKRVDQMMDIWGGIDSFKGFEPKAVTDNGTGHHLLNGPSLEADNDVANQDDIDALFD